jgi:hypothetical protein
MYRLSTAGRRGAAAIRCAAYAGQAWLAGTALYLLVLLLAGRRPGPPPADAATPQATVTILMPAHDEAAGIRAAIASNER